MFFSGLLKQIQTWDRASKSALVIAVILLAIALLSLVALPQIRTVAMMSAAGLFIAVQVIVMWGNRTMLAPYTEAQQHFIAGDFVAARDILRAYVDEQNEKGKPPRVDALVLLGNAYRNLGQLRESESVLRIALARRPRSHFALYGLGKIRLALGDYASAIKHFSDALQNGAPAVARFDLALAYYLNKDDAASIQLLQKLPESTEVHRTLMAAHILQDLQQSMPPATPLVEQGLPFWIAEAGRCADTPYGDDLKTIIKRLQQVS